MSSGAQATQRLAQRQASAVQQIVLHVYDVHGTRMSWAAFRAAQENGHGSNGDNDTLVDPATLQIESMWPLGSSGSASGDPVLALPARPAALTLAWPTSDGYSNLIVNLPAQGGTYVFNYLAAEQVVSDVDAAHAARPWYAAKADYLLAIATAHTKLDDARTAKTEPLRGSYGAQALDSAVHAETLLLAEAGLQHTAPRPTGQEWGVTFDDISGGDTDLRGVAAMLAPAPGDGWIRLVFDASEAAPYYAAEVTQAHALGLHVVGQFLDSSDMKAVGEAAWQTRVRSYVATLPTVDEWEVGNEVNGNWLGSSVVAKVTYAATYVKQHTRARTMLTFYWQLGEDVAKDSMFDWIAANVAPSLVSEIDDVGVSLYPEANPMGAAFERVMNALHARFPAQHVLITELDYWSSDLDHAWWWGSKTDPSGAGRLAVARLYQSAMMSYPFSGGGAFWWYYVEEVKPNGTLWNALSALHRESLGL